MTKPLRALIVEDSEDDCLMLKSTLARAGYEVTYERVETAEAMSAVLAHKPWDIVISDHRMPQFSSLAALKLCREHDANIPFIVVSGSIGEELAVTAMKAGADDYVMKDNLTRLVPPSSASCARRSPVGGGAAPSRPSTSVDAAPTRFWKRRVKESAGWTPMASSTSSTPAGRSWSDGRPGN